MSCRPQLALGLLLVVFGCHRQPPPPGAERVAVLPLDNLTGDHALDGTVRAIAPLALRQWANQPGRISWEATSAPAAAGRATTLLHGRVSRRQDQLQLALAWEAVSPRRIVRTRTLTCPVTGGAVALAEAMAREAGPVRHPAPTRNVESARLFGEALLAASAPEAVGKLQAATSADPAFGPAYVLWADLLSSQPETQPALRQLLSSIENREASLPELDRSRLALRRATLSGDPAALREAVRQAAESDPGNVTLTLQAATSELQARQYDRAAELYRRVLQAEPANADALNQLGYALAFRGDLPGARQALEEAQRLSPASANAWDSLGEVHLLHGRFTEAAGYFQQAHQAAPGFLAGQSLWKSAYSWLMARNAAKAEEAHRRYLQPFVQARDPLVPLRQARWLHLSGQPQEAVTLLERTPAVGTIAETTGLQLALWAIERADAAEAIRRAEPLARTSSDPAIRATATLCLYWAGVLRGQSLRPAPSPLAEAVAALLRKDFATAAPLWEHQVAALPGTERGFAQEAYGWSLLELGRRPEAQRLAALHPIPRPDDLVPLSTTLLGPVSPWRTKL